MIGHPTFDVDTQLIDALYEKDYDAKMNRVKSMYEGDEKGEKEANSPPMEQNDSAAAAVIEAILSHLPVQSKEGAKLTLSDEENTLIQDFDACVNHLLTPSYEVAAEMYQLKKKERG